MRLVGQIPVNVWCLSLKEFVDLINLEKLLGDISIRLVDFFFVSLISVLQVFLEKMIK